MIHTHPFWFVLLILSAICFFLAIIAPTTVAPTPSRPWYLDFRVRLVALGLLFWVIVQILDAAQ